MKLNFEDLLENIELGEIVVSQCGNFQIKKVPCAEKVKWWYGAEEILLTHAKTGMLYRDNDGEWLPELGWIEIDLPTRDIYHSLLWLQKD